MAELDPSDPRAHTALMEKRFKEIATSLNISLKTVEVHRHNILKKLKLKNSASLVNFINTNATYI